MDFKSILDLKEPVKGVTRPAFFLDLNADQILERITKGNRGILEYFEYFPLDEECADYRLDIYTDIRKAGLYEALLRFVTSYNEFRDIENKKKSTRIQIQKPVWHFCGMEIYTRCLLELKNALDGAELFSLGLNSLKELLNAYTGTPDFSASAQKSLKLKDSLDSLQLKADYANGRIQVSILDPLDAQEKKETGEALVESQSDDEDNEDLEAYENFLSGISGTNEKEFVNPFSSIDELTSFEQEIVKIAAKRKPEIFKEADRLYSDKPEFEEAVFSRLANELRFYLSFYEFETGMEKKGFVFSRPCKSTDGRMNGEDLFDLALACVNSDKGKPVISNSFSFEKNELFFVLTGPNQGGKTTFARSLGQLIYFSKIGLEVPAAKAEVPYFSDILTHFSVEESVETGRGKLMEELVRLSPMMKESKGNAFVVINELFTTAANYDAIIMGQNVLKHFLDAGCHGIYVTHLKELCDIDSRIVGLSAQLDENGRQNFKILKKSVDYEGCAKNQVEKYGLGYDALNERLKRLKDKR